MSKVQASERSIVCIGISSSSVNNLCHKRHIHQIIREVIHSQVKVSSLQIMNRNKVKSIIDLSGTNKSIPYLNQRCDVTNNELRRDLSITLR